MGKEKKEKRKSEGGEDQEETGLSWEELVSRTGPIAQPLASKKLTKRLYKCVKKGKQPAFGLECSWQRTSNSKEMSANPLKMSCWISRIQWKK